MVEVTDYPIPPRPMGSMGIDEARRVVYHILKEGFALLKEKPQYLDRIFHKLSQAELGQMKTWLRDNEINLIHGYARKDAKAPLVSILTVNETTEQSYLEDNFGIEQAPDVSFIGELSNFREQASVIRGGRVKVQLEVWQYAENPDLLQYLYVWCWVLLHSSRRILEAQGITPGELTGGDVAPVGEFKAEYVYARRLVMPLSGDRSYAVADDLIQELEVRVCVLNESIT